MWEFSWMTCYSANVEWHATAQALHTWTISYIHALLQRKRWTTCYSASAEKLKTTTAFHHIQILQRKRYTPMSNTEILQPKALEFATRSQTNMISLVRFPERISLFYLCVDLVLISFWSRFYLVFIFFYLFLSCSISFVSLRILFYQLFVFCICDDLATSFWRKRCDRDAFC